MCVDQPETYAQRRKKREEEIQALKDAMEAIESEQEKAAGGTGIK